MNIKFAPCNWDVPCWFCKKKIEGRPFATVVHGRYCSEECCDKGAAEYKAAHEWFREAMGKGEDK